MKTIEVLSETGTFAELVELARKEKGLLLLKSGQPVAQVLPMPEPTGRRIAPLHPDSISVSEDFDAPLSEDFWIGRE